jgi:outer membrane protein assembly factor BamB
LGVHGAPVAAGAVVYVPTQNGLLRAFSALTGDPLWSFGRSSGLVSSPAVYSDTVYVARERIFYALDAATGGELWRFPADSLLYSAPLLVDDRVYFGSEVGRVYALARQDGALLWEAELGGRVLWPIAFADGRLFVGVTQDLVALDAASGAELWRAAVGVDWSPHAVSGGLIYAGAIDGAFFALDAATGAVVWRAESPGGDWSSPAVGGGLVIAGNRDQTVQAFDAATGEPVWTFVSEDWAVADPVLAGGVLYIGVGNHDRREGPRHLYALDAATGAELWRFRANGRLLSAPVIHDGVLYLLTTVGGLYALH